MERHVICQYSEPQMCLRTIKTLRRSSLIPIVYSVSVTKANEKKVWLIRKSAHGTFEVRGHWRRRPWGRPCRRGTTSAHWRGASWGRQRATVHSEEQKWKKILPETNYFSWFYRPRINVIPTLPNVTTVPRTAKEIVDAPRKAVWAPRTRIHLVFLASAAVSR